MTERRIRYLPVLDGGALTGIISIGDIDNHHLAEIGSEAEALCHYVVGPWEQFHPQVAASPKIATGK